MVKHCPPCLYTANSISDFWCYLGDYGCIHYPRSEFRQSVPGARRYQQHVEHLFGTYRFGGGDLMQDCLSGDVEQLRGMLLRPAKAGVGGVGALGHDRGDVAARRDQLRQHPEHPRKRAERTAHRRTDLQPGEL